MATLTEKTMSLQDRAQEARSHFEQTTRHDELGETYWRKRVNAPQWVYDLTLAAHDAGEILPDDWRYAFIVEALDLLADFEDTDEAFDALEADTYTAELTAWLASSVTRVAYLDDAINEYGDDIKDGFMLLGTAQTAEKRGVFYAVRSFLEQMDDDA